MGRYTIIADVSEEIVRTLRRELVPKLISDENAVGMCSPQEQEEMSLGVFLYDIQESEDIRRHRMTDIDDGRQKYPPAYLSLYYMLTAYSQSDRKYQMSQEQRILGQTARYFHDYPMLEIDGEYVPVQMLRISTEDKLKLWNFNGKPFQVSLFYKVSPVRLDSQRFRDVTRVRTAEFGVDKWKERGV